MHKRLAALAFATFFITCSAIAQIPAGRAAMAWRTNESGLGSQMVCIAIKKGNTTVLSVNKFGQILTLESITRQDRADCERGLKIALKEKTVTYASAEDLGQ